MSKRSRQRRENPAAGASTVPTAAAATAPVLAPGHTYGSVTDKISAIVLTRGTTRSWWIGLGISLFFVNVLMVGVTYLIATGIGI